MSDNKPEYKGARFYKCALQVNPFEYIERHKQHRNKVSVADEKEYNEKMLQACQDNGIEVVGLADHGSVDSSEALRHKLEEGGITVFPGFEISSEGGVHMVCLYPRETTREDLYGYLAQLMGENAKELRETPTHPSPKSCEDIAKMIINEQHGFWYAAHMIGKNGLLRISGAGDNHVNLWKREDLVVAGQIHGKVQDLDDNYRNIIENKNLEYKREKSIAVINANDVYGPDLLADEFSSCLIKMTQPNFDAFKKAFFDPESRIRLNHESKKKVYSVIESIQWEGTGYFGESDCALSENLNAFIGGRGTGKSTLLESIRFVLDLPLLDNDNKKSMEGMRNRNFEGSKVTLTVVSKKQTGERYKISRRHGEEKIRVTNKEGVDSDLTPKDLLPDIQFLGQNEILAIERDPSAMRDLIYRLLPNSAQLDIDINEVQKKLTDNREKMLRVQKEYDELDVNVRDEGALQEQAKQLDDLGIAEKLQNVTRLADEDVMKAKVGKRLEKIRQWLDDYPSIDLDFLGGGEIDQMPNAKIILSVIKPMLDNAKKSLDEMVKQMDDVVSSVNADYESNLSVWEEQSQHIKGELNKAMNELPGSGGTSGVDLGKRYADIVQKLALIKGQKEDHAQKEQLLKQIRLERNQLLEEYRNAAFRKSSQMSQGIAVLNQKFEKKMKVVLKRKGDLSKLKEFLLGIQGIGESRIKSLYNGEDLQIDLVEWAKLIIERKKEELLSKTGFANSVVEKLLSMSMEQCLQLQEVPLDDEVHVELNIDHGVEGRYVATENLSTGQKCTAILNLLLLYRDEPLIVDQPEDHLDNAFIAERIVHDLRKSKTNRQFVFSTHNANIPVFGDAELIAVLSHEDGKGVIKHQGGIDDEQVCSEASNILEGGEEAFNTRKKKYGF